jgi:hypothetical protein
MLTIEALKHANELATILDSSGVLIQAIPGTPLAAIVDATRSDPNFARQSGAEYTVELEDICYIANAKDPVLDVSKHDQVFGNIVDIAARAVKSHVLFAKTVVAPAVSELADKTMVTMAETVTAASLCMEVVVNNTPIPYLNNSLHSMVRKYEEVPFDQINLGMRCPDITTSDLVALMHTGSAGLDADISTWVAARGETFFTDIWANIFQIKQNGMNERKVYTLQSFTEDRNSGPEAALCIYLIAQRLSEETIPGIDMSANAFQSKIIEYRNQAAARVCRALDEYESIVKSGVLVSSITGTVTTVNDVVYKQWIADGGENEVLFGNMLNLPGLTTVQQININAPKLKAAWVHHVTLLNVVESNKRFSKFKNALLRHFQDQMRALTPEEDSSQENIILSTKLFMEQLDNVTTDDMQNIYTLALRLICRSRFYRTEAERILSGIDRVKRDNPNVDVREAAAISVIEYVAYWVSTQYKPVVI